MNLINSRLKYKITCPKCATTQSWWLGLIGMISKEHIWGRYKWACYNCGTLQAFPLTAILYFLGVAIFSAGIFGYLDNRYDFFSQLTNFASIAIFLLLFSLWFPFSLLLTFFFRSFQVEVISSSSIFKKKSWTDDIFISGRLLALKCGLLKAMALMFTVIFSFLLTVVGLFYCLGTALGVGK
ncbi:MAG: hypothetical protein FD156_448 [Nitrospirae bacterium]|nr:MAG: hypothetical protein FD156_448 [Nitrospirota bacterium]